jgi:GTP cyclohydrolase FolE2
LPAVTRRNENKISAVYFAFAWLAWRRTPVAQEIVKENNKITEQVAHHVQRGAHFSRGVVAIEF